MNDISEKNKITLKEQINILQLEIEQDIDDIKFLEDQIQLKNNELIAKTTRLESIRKKQNYIDAAKEKNISNKEVIADNIIEEGIRHYYKDVPIVIHNAKKNIFILNSCRNKFDGEFTKTTLSRINAYLDEYFTPFFVTYRGSKENRKYYVQYKGELHPFDNETFEINMNELFPDFKVNI